MSLGAFYDYIYKEKAQLSGLVKASFDRFIDGLEYACRPFTWNHELIITSDIRTKLTSEEEDAYLVSGMLPIYDEVRQLKGKSTMSQKLKSCAQVTETQVVKTRRVLDQRLDGPLTAGLRSRTR